MKHAIAMLYGGLFARIWQNEIQQGIFWIGFIRGAMIGILVGTLIQMFA